MNPSWKTLASYCVLQKWLASDRFATIIQHFALIDAGYHKESFDSASPICKSEMASYGGQLAVHRNLNFPSDYQLAIRRMELVQAEFRNSRHVSCATYDFNPTLSSTSCIFILYWLNKKIELKTKFQDGCKLWQ